jgi:hypothetical protein
MMMVGMCGQMMTVVRGWMQAIVTATPQIILYFAKRQRQLKAWVAYYHLSYDAKHAPRSSRRRRGDEACGGEVIACSCFFCLFVF